MDNNTWSSRLVKNYDENKTYYLVKLSESFSNTIQEYSAAQQRKAKLNNNHHNNHHQSHNNSHHHSNHHHHHLNHHHNSSQSAGSLSTPIANVTNNKNGTSNTGRDVPTIRFLGAHGGAIRFPNGKCYDFSIEQSANTVECIRQTGNKWESVGKMTCCLHVKGKDDVYQRTRTKMEAAEQEKRKNCTKLLEENTKSTNTAATATAAATNNSSGAKFKMGKYQTAVRSSNSASNNSSSNVSHNNQNHKSHHTTTSHSHPNNHHNSHNSTNHNHHNNNHATSNNHHETSKSSSLITATNATTKAAAAAAATTATNYYNSNHDTNATATTTNSSKDPNNSSSSNNNILCKYPDITNEKQLKRYKADFDKDYKEYQTLHGYLQKIEERFSKLRESLKQSVEGSPEWESAKERIFSEYERVKGDSNFHKARNKYKQLYSKLAHIKEKIFQYKRQNRDKFNHNNPNHNNKRRKR